ncbi:DNA-protecting protein DprA [Lottiidibacillus patelloidae]|uniref:DNA-protecting protein DprA n=1 Tax=Lottiidibacillus patelloidae TaxID=2670334 RepID=A0A263BXY3_9BACI|nr:DNA-processing protein DprA [Lottiidibacillus patelloidae]OZM58593.1 DNA-protecting protein DprA [Lottiidibacillus patelloidae]
MDDIKKRLVHISACSHISWSKLAEFFKDDTSLCSVYNYSVSELIKTFKWKEKNAENFIKDLHSLSITRILNNYKSKNIKVVTIFDDNYPRLLKEIYDPPWVLYCKGNPSLFSNNKKISIVGTRYPSQYGLKCVEYLTKPFIQQGWMIISGLAYGIDTAAHLQAMKKNGATIAVLGSGINTIYPKNNEEIGQEIAKNHLLISEYTPNTLPKRWMFPRRNRIISGLSLATIVIEANRESGSLITANLANMEGREVFAVPGSILSQKATGTNELIMAGAQLAVNGEKIIEQLQPMLDKY